MVCSSFHPSKLDHETLPCLPPRTRRAENGSNRLREVAFSASRTSSEQEHKEHGQESLSSNEQHSIDRDMSIEEVEGIQRQEVIHEGPTND